MKHPCRSAAYTAGTSWLAVLALAGCRDYYVVNRDHLRVAPSECPVYIPAIAEDEGATYVSRRLVLDELGPSPSGAAHLMLPIHNFRS